MFPQNLQIHHLQTGLLYMIYCFNEWRHMNIAFHFDVIRRLVLFLNTFGIGSSDCQCLLCLF